MRPQIEWSLISCMELVRRDHGVVYSDRVVPVLMYGIGEKLVRRDHDVV
jgi:hypothetical protein